jgi:cyclophilin family peptidyl-prolyl cis-trans isomerase
MRNGIDLNSQATPPAAPDLVLCNTSLGPFTMRLRDDWSPLGAARVRQLVQQQFYTDIAFFRVNKWISQFGAVLETPKEKADKPWADVFRQRINDDPNPFAGTPWWPGVVAMPGGGPNTRTSQLLVVRSPNVWNGGSANRARGGGAMGDGASDAPVGEIVDGMERVFHRLYGGYGDLPEPNNPRAKPAPDQGKIFTRGNAYIRREFPRVSFIHSCAVVPFFHDPKTPPGRRRGRGSGVARGAGGGGAGRGRRRGGGAG